MIGEKLPRTKLIRPKNDQSIHDLNLTHPTQEYLKTVQTTAPGRDYYPYSFRTVMWVLQRPLVSMRMSVGDKANGLTSPPNDVIRTGTVMETSTSS